jgi:hypothetical protein
MSDLIFKTNGEEYFCIPSPFSNNYYHLPKCPETKLEIKMTETDISKVLIEGEYATIMGVKYKRVEEPKTPVEEAYKEWWGQYPELETDSEYDDMRWQGFQAGYELAQVKDGCPEPPEYDEIEHDMSENVENKTLKEVINRWWMNTFTSKNMWSVNECIDDLADQIEFWILRNKNT